MLLKKMSMAKYNQNIPKHDNCYLNEYRGKIYRKCLYKQKKKYFASNILDNNLCITA